MSFQNTKINPKRFHPSQIKFYLFLLPLAVVMSIPVLFVLLSAFKPMEELFKFPPTIFPRNWTLENFAKMFDTMSSSSVPASRYIFNTLLITVLTMVLCVFFSVFAGYVLSKSKLRIKSVLNEVNTLAMMFVPVAVSIPRYIIIVKLGLYDSFFANILPIVAVPVGLFLLKQFIDQIPDALIEAARIDGASELRIVWKIIFPLLKPPIATVALLSFQSAWGNVEASNLFIDDETLKSFAYFMTTFQSSNMGIAGTGISAASALIMFVPNLIIFIVLQSKVMDTMSTSGIK